MLYLNNVEEEKSLNKIKQRNKQIQMQAQAQCKASSRTSCFNEVQKQQAVAETNIQFEQAKSQFEIQRMQKKLKLKSKLMEQKFQYDMQLKKHGHSNSFKREKEIEDRKDERTRITSYSTKSND